MLEGRGTVALRESTDRTRRGRRGPLWAVVALRTPDPVRPPRVGPNVTVVACLTRALRIIHARGKARVQVVVIIAVGGGVVRQPSVQCGIPGIVLAVGTATAGISPVCKLTCFPTCDGVFGSCRAVFSWDALKPSLGGVGGLGGCRPAFAEVASTARNCWRCGGDIVAGVAWGAVIAGTGRSPSAKRVVGAQRTLDLGVALGAVVTRLAFRLRYQLGACVRGAVVRFRADLARGLPGCPRKCSRGAGPLVGRTRGAIASSHALVGIRCGRILRIVIRAIITSGAGARLRTPS